MPVSSISVFAEPDDYQAALGQDGRVDLLVTGRGRFCAQLSRVALPRLTLSIGSETLARVAIITVVSQMVRISLPPGARSAQICGGTRLRPDEIVTYGAGHRLYERTEGACQWRSIWIYTKDINVFSRALTGAALDVPSGEARWRPKPADLRALSSLYNDAMRAAATHPTAAVDARAASGLKQQLVHALVECLLGKAIQDGVAARRHQTEILVRFEDRLKTCISTKAGISSLSEALGIPARTLRAYCQAYLGMSPHEYIRLRRLQLTRQALQATRPHGTSVSAIAREYGFDGMGRFAIDYNAQFGELPSATLRRAIREESAIQQAPES